MILHCLKMIDNILKGFLGTLLNIKIKKKACAQLKVLSGFYPLSLNYLLDCVSHLRQWLSPPHCIVCVLVYRHKRQHSLTVGSIVLSLCSTSLYLFSASCTLSYTVTHDPLGLPERHHDNSMYYVCMCTCVFNLIKNMIACP